MCSWCEVSEGYCFCGTTRDPEGRTTPCEVRGGSGFCSVCGHTAGMVPADTSAHGYDYAEYE